MCAVANRAVCVLCCAGANRAVCVCGGANRAVFAVQLWRLVEKAPMGADGWLCAPNKPLLSECWEETAKVLSERASNATTVEVPRLLTSGV